jgi:hypothetical protein
MCLMTARAYTLCMDGHWFSGVVCPMDGSESEWSRAVAEAVERLANETVTVARLVEAGLPVEAAEQVLVIDQRLRSWPTVRPIEIIELADAAR